MRLVSNYLRKEIYNYSKDMKDVKEEVYFHNMFINISLYLKEWVIVFLEIQALKTKTNDIIDKAKSIEPSSSSSQT